MARRFILTKSNANSDIVGLSLRNTPTDASVVKVGPAIVEAPPFLKIT